MNLQVEDERAVALGAHERAVYVGSNNLWTVQRRGRGRWRGYCSTTTSDILERLRDDSFERRQALRIVGQR
jgi:hypothetical protein